jgi:hypothetical protein
MNRLTLMHTQSVIRHFSSLANQSTVNSLSATHTETVSSTSSLKQFVLPPNSTKNNECMMLLTISADCVAELRHLIMRTCGEWIVFIRTQPIAHATKMKVWLCLSNPASDMVMDAVMRALPSAEFGQITHG